MNEKANVLNWFEIAVNDINRAKKFYEEVFGINIEVAEMMGMQMGFFPYENMGGKVGGAIVQSSMHKPSMDGAVIYLNANPDLSAALSRVEKAGGKVAMPKTHINEDTGYMAFFIDTEGNKVGMHSNK